MTKIYVLFKNVQICSDFKEQLLSQIIYQQPMIQILSKRIFLIGILMIKAPGSPPIHQDITAEKIDIL